MSKAQLKRDWKQLLMLTAVHKPVVESNQVHLVNDCSLLKYKYLKIVLEV